MLRLLIMSFDLAAVTPSFFCNLNICRRLSVLGAQKQQRKERENLSSVKIQAWWRGTMVRKELGPFNRYYKSGKAKGAKAKKKTEKDKKK